MTISGPDQRMIDDPPTTPAHPTLIVVTMCLAVMVILAWIIDAYAIALAALLLPASLKMT
jgi:hypothetical protein